MVDKFYTHIDTRIQSATLLEDRFCYISIQKGASNKLVKRFASSKNMLALIDFDKLNESFDATPYVAPITSAIVGINSKVYHSLSNDKIIFMKSFNRFMSVPLLH